TLCLTNEGEAVASNVKVVLTIPQLLTLVNHDNYWYFQKIQPKKNITIPLILYAQQTSANTPLQLLATISYVDGYGNLQTESRTFGLELVPSVGGRIEVTASQSKASPGKTFNLQLTLHNSGSVEVKNVKLKLLTLNSVFVPVSSSSVVSLGSLTPGSNVSVTFTLKVSDSALAITYPLNVQVEYVEDSKPVTNPTIIQQTIGINVSGPVRIVVQKTEVKPSHVKPGDEGVLVSVLLLNDGSLTAENVKAKLLLTKPFKPSWGGSNEIYIGKLRPYTVTQANFYLDVDESAKAEGYDIPLLLSYHEGSSSGNGCNTILTVPFYVYGKAKFTVEKIETSPEMVRQGDSGVTIKVTIKNVGSNKAEGLIANLAAGEEFSGTMTTYVGVVGVNDTRTAEFNVDVSSSATVGVHKVDLVLSWSEDNEPYIQTITIPIQVYPYTIPQIYWISIIIVAMIVIVGGIYRKIKRKMET
ncbi:hypothetical protein DRO26_03630, partial [Candidatus Bathyarchaeota archaeon]